MPKLLYDGTKTEELSSEQLALEGIEAIRELLRTYLAQADKRGQHIVEACKVLGQLIELRAAHAPR